MTKRSALRQWMLETRATAMAVLAGRLFTFKQTGLDGFLKRAMLKPKSGPPKS